MAAPLIKLSTILTICVYVAVVINDKVQAQDPEESDDFPEPRIYGGRPALPGEIPYQLAYFWRGRRHCGGALIEVDGVQVGLTAAHCISPFQKDTFIYAGDVDIKNVNKSGQIRKVAKLVPHDNAGVNDIEIIFFDEPFELNENVQPIALPEPFQDTTGPLLASGWGQTENYKPSDVLLVVEVNIVDNPTCKKIFEERVPFVFIMDQMMCTGNLGVGGKGVCSGDSGGPVRAIEGNYLAGLVSGGEECASKVFPEFHVRVSHYVDWIRENVASNA